MAQERIELRFSSANTEEQAVIEALDAQGKSYGAKGRFLRTRMLRGYVALMREVESIRRETDPLATLDRLARSVNAGHYRVLRALLYPRSPTMPVRPRGAGRSASAADPANTPPVAPSKWDHPLADVAPAASGKSPASAPLQGSREAEATSPMPVPNWSVFAEIAGKKGQ